MKRLYHGTSSDRLDEVETRGIRPRSQTGQSNWDLYKSRDDMVYLTTAYPLYFALVSAERSNSEAVIIEVDQHALDKDNLYPDEDYIAYVIVKNSKRSIEEVHPIIKKHLEDYQPSWRFSLKNMATCCYRGTIGPEAILRYAKIDPKKRPELCLEMGEPVISIVNYMVLGKFYKDFVAWVMGDRKMLPQIERAKEDHKNTLGLEDEAMKKICEEAKRRIKFWKEQSRDRSGIEVVETRKAHV